MADLTFDAVVCGGGNKGLMLAMYLSKYAGMSVGIFERRHEIGGGLATEETAAPGFRGNTHANIILPLYYAPIWRDFPEFWDYGGQFDQYPVSDGSVFKDTGKGLAIYSLKADPTGEKTAKEIARFSQKDADLWPKIIALSNSDEVLRVMMDSIFLPPEYAMDPKVMERMMAPFMKVMEAGLNIDSQFLAASPKLAAKMLFESPELQYCLARFVVSGCRNVNDANQGGEALGLSGTLAQIGYNRGGTHQIAHACHQILVQNGVKFFTHAEVAKAIIENGVCTGVKLTDGSVIRARKCVVSAGLSAAQLCFDLIGRDIIGPAIARKVDNLSTSNIGNLMWYSFALNEHPKYKAAAFNPDLNKCEWLGLAESADVEHVARECLYANLGQLPPLNEWNPVIWAHSIADPSYAPPGKCVAQCEMQGPRATDLPEKEWLKLKMDFAHNLIKVWGEYAPNVNYDNLIGIDTNSPWDHVRMKNLAPHGNFAGIDMTWSQRGANRPTPELANYRTPIKNLFCTGGYWHQGGEASASQSYNCYRSMANDLGLGKPWEEKGKEEPDSLVEMTRWSVKKAREAFPIPA